LTQKTNLYSDERLMLLIASKDALAFELLYERYQSRMFGYLLRQMAYDSDKANDVLHDVFLKVIENAKKFDAAQSFKTWLFTIAYNLCKNEFRKKEYSDEHQRHIANHVDFWEEQNPDHALFQEQFEQSAQKLSYEHRTVFELRHKEGLALKEIAEIMDSNLGTIKSRLHYATKFLAVELQAFNPNTQQYGN
jgi:RNA polymerase sigma-70 factor (ECF subfamily)